MQPTYNRKIDTSATYTHRIWNHQPNNPLLAFYDRLSMQPTEKGNSEYLLTLAEMAETNETTEAHTLDFYRTYEPTCLVLVQNESGRYEYRVTNSDVSFDYFQTMMESTREVFDISLHPMHDQSVAHAKTLTCPNERRNFARQMTQRLYHLNQRTPTGQLQQIFKRALDGDEEAKAIMQELDERNRLKNARKLNELL